MRDVRSKPLIVQTPVRVRIYQRGVGAIVRNVSYCVLRLRIGSGIKQRIDRFRLTLTRRDVQRSPAARRSSALSVRSGRSGGVRRARRTTRPDRPGARRTRSPSRSRRHGAADRPRSPHRPRPPRAGRRSGRPRRVAVCRHPPGRRTPLPARRPDHPRGDGTSRKSSSCAGTRIPRNHSGSAQTRLLSATRVTFEATSVSSGLTQATFAAAGFGVAPGLHFTVIVVRGPLGT